MRALACLILLLAACSARKTGSEPPLGSLASNPAIEDGGTGAAPADGGAEDGGPDAAPADGGAVDGGAADGGADAGPQAAVPSLPEVPCPAAPRVLWSRTFETVDVDFRGVADARGNLFWLEYDPRSVTNPDPQAWLASADSDGKDRFRVPAIAHATEPGPFLLAAGKIVTAKLARIAAYDAETGASAWVLDLSSRFPDGYALVQGAADLGNGQLAFAVGDYGHGSAVFVADLETGAVKWSMAGAGSDANARVYGSDGAGRALVTTDGAATLSLVDRAGNTLWNQAVPGALLLGWLNAPWLAVGATGSPPRAGRDYVAVPGDWFSAVEGPGAAFSVQFGPDARTPDSVMVLERGAVAATAAVPGSSPYNGLATYPFLAGTSGDHLIMLSQPWHSQPALCYPSAPGAAVLSRIDSSAAVHCALPLPASTGFTGAALVPGRFIAGRITYSGYSCGYHVNPFTLEAYDLPGEALAPAGWVQRGGNPGQALRPR